MTQPESTLKRTPLYHRHVALGARLVEFGGWEMPVQDSDIIEEHRPRAQRCRPPRRQSGALLADLQ